MDREAAKDCASELGKLRMQWAVAPACLCQKRCDRDLPVKITVEESQASDGENQPSVGGKYRDRARWMSQTENAEPRTDIRTWRHRNMYVQFWSTSLWDIKSLRHSYSGFHLYIKLWLIPTLKSYLGPHISKIEFTSTPKSFHLDKQQLHPSFSLLGWESCISFGLD